MVLKLFINTSVKVVFLNNHRDCRPALSDLLHIVYTKKPVRSVSYLFAFSKQNISFF